MLVIYQVLLLCLARLHRSEAQVTVTTTLGPALPIPPHSPATFNYSSVPAYGDGSSRGTSDCKVAYTVGYGYRRIYHWPDSIPDKNSTSAILNFKVRAFSDAHILLSTSSSPVDREPVYEIVIGAGKNSFSDIRRVRRGSTKVTVTTQEILSPYELRGFWIKLSNDGTVEVGREKEDLAFMAWRDPQPLPVRYFGFCTWTGTVGKWEYDCPNDNLEPEEESEEVEENITWAQRLRRDVLSLYDPFSRPVNNPNKITDVHIHYGCQHINLDENKNTILVHGIMTMYWVDEKLVWDVEKYGGLKILHAAIYEIWTPELILYNAADGAGDNLFNSATSQVTVHNDGSVMWSPQANLQTLCSLTMDAWPHDQHKCTLRIGAWSHASLIDFKLMENGTAIDDKHTSSQWNVERVSASLVEEPHPWAHPYDNEGDGDTSTTGTVFHLEIAVRRKSSIYHIVLLVPIAALALSLVASFWVSPLQWSRFFLCLMNLMITILFLITISSTLPPTAGIVPQIITLFDRGIVVATVALIVTVIVTMLTRHKFRKPPPKIITDQLNGILGLVLLLPPPNTDSVATKKTYGHLEEPKSLIEENSDDGNEISVTVMSPIDADKDQWIRLATAIDRFVFFTYLIFLSIVLIQILPSQSLSMY